MAHTSQTTFLSDVLGSEAIPPAKLAYFRARLGNQLHAMVLQRFANEERAGRITRAQLARRIGKKPEQVTRWLGSRGNWTIETLSDLLIGLGCELKPEIIDLKEKIEMSERMAQQSSTILDRTVMNAASPAAETRGSIRVY